VAVPEARIEETDDAKPAYREVPRNFRQVKSTWPV
jgi:hypothetical protein